MNNDLELKDKIRQLILEAGKYLTFSEVIEKLGVPDRGYLSYRGINVTSINKELGFLRRPPREFKKTESFEDEKAVAIKHLREYILSVNRYVHTNEFRKIGNLSLYYKVSKYGIDLHALNVDLGYRKVSSMGKIPLTDTLDKIEEYIRTSDHYVSQQELCDKFGFSLSYLTKSKVCTVSLNFAYGKQMAGNYFELLAADTLKKLGVEDIIMQKTFPSCISKRGRLLRFDIYLPKYKVLIELDGSQHWDKSHRYYSDTVLENDAIKNDYAKLNGYTLVRIPFPGRFQAKDLLNIELLELLESLHAKADLEMENANAKKVEGLGDQQPIS